MFLYLNNVAMVSYVCHCGVLETYNFHMEINIPEQTDSFIHNFK